MRCGIGWRGFAANSRRQIKHGDHPAANFGHAADARMRRGEPGERGTRNHLLHLEHIDAEQLALQQRGRCAVVRRRTARTHTEQQQRQPVVAGQLGALVDAVQQPGSR